MIRNRKIWLSFLIVATWWNFAYCETQLTPRFRVSLPSFKLTAQERVVTFECEIRSATIEQITRIPSGWTLAVTNDNGDVAALHANRIVDLAALTDNSYFADFMILEMNYPNNVSPEGPPFSIDCRITISNGDERTREVHFSTSAIVLTSVTK